MPAKRNESLNVLKLISCVVVIFLHCPFPGKFGEMIIYALRFSVPVFFLISGYFSFQKPGEWYRKKIVTTLKTTAALELLYGIFNFLLDCVAGQVPAAEFFNDFPRGWEFIKTLFFGSFFNGTLWYLYAAFWTWCILYLLHRKGLMEKAVWAVPPLLFLHIFGRWYCQNHFSIDQLVFLFRSAILFGVPFALMGRFFARHREKIAEKLTVFRCLGIVFAGHVLIVVEFFLTGQYMDLHLSTVVIAAGLFLLALVKPECPRLRLMQFMGDRLSMWIYYDHLLVISLMGLAGERLHLEENVLFLWAKPVLVFAGATLLALGIHVVKEKRRIGRN